MPAEHTDHTGLEKRLASVEERLAVLEREAEPDGGIRPGALEAEAFWALRGLRDRLSAQPDAAPSGAVLFTGAITLPTGTYHEWQQGAFTDALLCEDWAKVSNAFSALAHPVRLLLLRQILGGERTVAQLQEHEGLGTSGQLYHHLRHLMAAGWLRSSGRGQYTVPEARVVPLLVAICAMTTPGATPASLPEPDDLG